jgi:hypothetical protein
MDVPFIEQVKIQAQVLVPLLKALRAELGEARANALVRKALGGLYRKVGEELWNARQGNLTEKMAPMMEIFASGNALDYQMLKQTPETYEFNITGCRYAQFYRELGEPELGFLLVCYQDVPMAEGFGPEVEFTRTQTIMQGASHCDFRFKLKQAAEEKER